MADAKEENLISSSTVEEKVSVIENAVESNDKDDEFAYLDREHFTSEKFKIEIRNLPKYYSMPDLKKLLNKKLNLEAVKVKRPHNGSHWIYACFRSEEAREAALKVVNGYKWKGKDLTADVAKAVPDPLVLKRKNAESGNSEGKRIKFENVEEAEEKLHDATAPLWRIPYEKQLEQKTSAVKSLLFKLKHSLSSTNPDLKGWLKEQGEKYEGLPCELLPIRPSPTTTGYRNKCEFSIGINECTGERTVGMRLASYAQGSVCVVSPKQLLHVPEVFKKACAVAEKFIRASNLTTYKQETHEGYWKSLTARYGYRTNQLMLMFILNPQQLTETELLDLEEQLRSFFTTGEGSSVEVHSLLLALQAKGSERPEPRCVKGETFITEEVLGYKFRISANSFFQINTEGAEILFNSISELSNLSKESSLIDICCGAGTIAICLSEKCGEVLGLEKWAEAVEDAKKNAEANGVQNSQFFAGTAEDILSAVVHRATKPNVVAVVDPPRAGLERNAVIRLRRTKNLQQFVYASCDPHSAMKNFIDLARAPSKQYPNDPFVPVRCIPVDMFPHTEGFELVIFFQRLSAVRPSTAE